MKMRIAASEVRVGDRVQTPAHGFWREVIRVDRKPATYDPERELAVWDYPPYHSGRYADGQELVWSAITDDQHWLDDTVLVERAEE